MAEYTGSIAGVRNKQLTPQVVDTVTLDWILDEVQVVTDGAADIYVEFGLDADPVIGGRRSWKVPATDGMATLPTRPSGDDVIYGQTIVRLASAGSPVYSVGMPGFVINPVGPQGRQGEPGPQGEQGEPGPPGADGNPAPQLVQTFAVPATTWSISHDLGDYPDVLTVDAYDRQIFGDVTYPDPAALVVVTFDLPFAGTARLKA